MNIDHKIIKSYLKVLVTIIFALAFSFGVYSDVQSSNKIMENYTQAREEFKTEFQGAQEKFNQAVDDFYKEDLNSRAISQNEPNINEKNNTVTRVDTKIAVQKTVNKEKKVYKDDFDRSFEKFDKEFNEKWKNF